MGKMKEIDIALDDVAEQIAESTADFPYEQRRAFLVRLKEETEQHIKDLDSEEEAAHG